MLDNVNGADVAASQRNRDRSIYVRKFSERKQRSLRRFIECSIKKMRILVSFSHSWCAVPFRSCSLKTSLQKLAQPRQIVSVITLEVATLSQESIVQKHKEKTVSPRPPQIAPALNMSGCTVNICFNPPPPPPLPMLQFTAEELNELFCSMYLRTQYASCVCTMLICHYTHSLLANILALISSCRFIC